MADTRDSDRRERSDLPTSVELMRVEAGNAGWVKVTYSHSTSELFARLRQVGAILRVVEFFVVTEAGLTDFEMSTKRIFEIEVWLQDPARRAEIGKGTEVAGPLMQELAESYGTTWSPRASSVDWLALQWLGQYPEFWEANPDGVTVRRPRRPSGRPKARHRMESLDFRDVNGRLTYDLSDGWEGEPGARRYQDDFLQRVAEAYRALAYVTSAPNFWIADASKVTKTTVDLWVRKARKAGLLPPGKPGRAG